jgi:hypothetical protein
MLISALYLDDSLYRCSSICTNTYPDQFRQYRIGYIFALSSRRAGVAKMVPTPGHEALTASRDGEPITIQKENKQGVRDSMVVQWLNKQVDRMDKHWTRLPSFTGSAAATCAIFLLGLCYRGISISFQCFNTHYATCR